MIRRVALASLAVFAAWAVLDFVIHGLLLGSTYAGQPELFRPQAEGGLLAGEGRIDMFVCLRRPDELSFAGGVFVVVRCDDAASWRVLKGKGIPVSADGATALLHNPVHLLGIEAPMSLSYNFV